jgi:hypothetical protein
LTLSHTHGRLVEQATKTQRDSFNLASDHPDDEIAQLIGKARYMKRLAERRKQPEERSHSA